MDERLVEARDEAERKPGVGTGYTEKQAAAFVQGVVWADANPKPHTITEAGYCHANRLFGLGPAATRQFLRDMGIEVADDA